MRAIAALLLCSCAPAVTAIPSSLPFVRTDPSLSGHVMSRDAAIVIAKIRIDDKKKCDASAIDCAAEKLILRFRAEQADKQAQMTTWWRTYGPGLLGGGIVTSFLAGAATALAIATLAFQR